MIKGRTDEVFYNLAKHWVKRAELYESWGVELVGHAEYKDEARRIRECIGDLLDVVEGTDWARKHFYEEASLKDDACEGCAERDACDGVGRWPPACRASPPKGPPPLEPWKTTGVCFATSPIPAPRSPGEREAPETRCLECYGTGSIGTGEPSGEGGEASQRCPECEGRGTVPGGDK